MNHFIIDCDPGHDDAVAILTAARYLNLVGVTTVFGNSTVENTTRNALNLLDAAGLSRVPVAAGAAGPLQGVLHSGETVHGKSGLDGARLPLSQRPVHALDAADFIHQAALEHDDLIIIAVAPQTNLATALARYPELKHRIRGISIMGGSTHIGNATPAAEFNILADPEAAARVFDSGIPITMVGLNVTTSFGVTANDISRLEQSDSFVAREIGGALAYYLSRQSAIYNARGFAPVHDVCAVLPFSHPALIDHEPMHVVVECDGRYTRGMTVCDQRGVISGEGILLTEPANARVAIAADGAGIVQLLLDTLLQFP
ncbi:MAG: nucleoside hydrolase [Pseudomonadota bacterium]